MIVILAFSVNVSAGESVEIGNYYSFSTTAADTVIADKNVKYYTLVLDTAINFKVGITNFAGVDCAMSEIEGMGSALTNEQCVNLYTRIYIRNGDENGTILADGEFDVRKKLSAGTYTIELRFDNNSWGEIELSTYEEESTEPKEINIGERDDYELSQLTPSVHNNGSYAEYYTFRLDEAKYLSFYAASYSNIDAALGYIEESDIVPILIYIISDDENGKVLTHGKDSVTTQLEAGTYTIELTTEAPSIYDIGDFEINLAVPMTIINNIMLDD